ncbi:IclR family transcriptional regulator [Phytoactinopolyspora halotolerans]|uniref:IclR family transcriptional regulator n=1 Tax=Phytoactinopolyspora halotolerans TaxID=1981512 RepID=A0A6L9SEK3_9ACTN|nr:IclR family transcriptional regulator [Phytoactinopolyspora halotolerans]NEE02892.1 IclR family transcriptional regulator [Phytoactinopolyspora halotolerans]
MGESSRVPALRHGVGILRHLARQGGPATAASIAGELGLPRSTVYHLLNELEREGLVVHLPEERRYGLGIGVFELGTAYSRHAPLARLARPLLHSLVDEVGHGAHLAVLHGREVLYLLEERAPGSPSLVTDVGVRLPAHLTASGRAMLAGLPAAQVRALFPDASAFTDRHGAGPQRLSELRAVLADVRQRGYATEDGEVTPGFASVSVAARDHTGYPVAAMAVTFDRNAVDERDWRALAAQIDPVAAELTRRIGGPDAVVPQFERRTPRP